MSTAEQQAREVQATDLDRQIAEAERRLQVSSPESCAPRIHWSL